MNSEDNSIDVNRPRPQKRCVLTPKELVDDAPRSVALTTWRNPTKHTLRFELFVRDGERRADGKQGAPVWCGCEVLPGEEVTLPSTFDKGIHDLDRDGRVIGGVATMLRRVDATAEPTFAPGVK